MRALLLDGILYLQQSVITAITKNTPDREDTDKVLCMIHDTSTQLGIASSILASIIIDKLQNEVRQA